MSRIGFSGVAPIAVANVSTQSSGDRCCHCESRGTRDFAPRNDSGGEISLTTESMLLNNQILLGSMLCQEVSNLFVASAGGSHQRSLPIFAPRIYVRTSFHEKLHGIEVCIRRCQHQCRTPVFAL